MLLFYDQKQFFEQNWFNTGLIDINNFKITYDIDEFISSNEKSKISFIFHGAPELSTSLHHLNQHSDCIFYFADHPNWINHVNLEMFNKVTWVIPGKYVKTYETKNLFWNAWMLEITNVYKNLGIDKFLNDISPYQPKSKYFDCLIGTERSHRNLMFELVSPELLEDKIILTYAGHKENPSYWYDDVQNKLDATALYNDIEIANCHYIPIQLYNQTAYTMVSETVSEKDLILVSEKVARPILAKRLFVVFSSPGYLNLLKELGFRTFDNVIDETYDSIVDEKDRFTAAMEQVVFLCNQNQDKILAQIQSIVEHNFNLLINTNYDKLLGSHITKILDDYSKI
jgi:hypothetical protein